MRAYIEINKKNLIDNYKKIKEQTNKDVICVVKSNAYGHGLLEVTKILSPLNPKMFAVSTIEEAIMIRKSLIFTPILLLGNCSSFSIASNYRITLTITSLEYLKKMIKSNLPLFAHLLINTGMNRDGIKVDEINEAIKHIQKSKVIVKGIFTHITNVEHYEKQCEVFNKALELFPHEKLIIHIAASSTYKIKNDTTNAVRVGLALYGLTGEDGLKPIMSLSCEYCCKIAVKKGDLVSYNNEPCLEDGYIYTLPIGYADGIFRSSDFEVYSDGLISKIGNICMDHTMIFSNKEFDSHNKFELIGEHLKVIDIANKNATIPYEIVAKLSSRLKRVVK